MLVDPGDLAQQHEVSVLAVSRERMEALPEEVSVGTPRFNLDLRGPLDEELRWLAREQGISKAKTVGRAITDYATCAASLHRTRS